MLDCGHSFPKGLLGSVPHVTLEIRGEMRPGPAVDPRHGHRGHFPTCKVG